jgi:hypothetical protein
MRVRDPRLLVLLSAALLGAAVAFPLGVIASHQFTDVPTSNSFHADIDALADAGVTSGCAAGKYCPKDFVTREQMAAFLNRLGALGPGKPPVVNADKVDGLHAGDLNYLIDNEQPSVVQLAKTWGAFEQVTVDAPTDGFVLVVGAVSIGPNDCIIFCYVRGAIEHSSTALADTVAQQIVHVPDDLMAMTMTRVIPVEAGLNTLQVRLQLHNFADGGLEQYKGQISAIFSPFGETHS